jgi:NAD(P)-dependent dehydrogenase (short-subunit alcohol dehydrogenase family)
VRPGRDQAMDARRLQEAPRPEVVVVTGGTAGVGRAVVREFARRGASVAILARGREALDATAREVEYLGGRALPLQADMANWDEVEGAATAVEEALGPIDTWVNNAMVSVFSRVIAMTADEYRRVTEVTYLGYVHGTIAALHRMMPRDRGCIVQVGSALAFRGIPLQSAYCGAKHAIVGFTDSLRCELLNEKSSVRVTEVHLPAMNTPQFGWVRSKLPRKPQPVPPVYQPETAAQAIYWAAHHKRRGLLFGWPTIISTSVNKVAPGLLDKYLAKSAVEGQQTNQPAEPDRTDNLFNPIPGDHGAHGEFDESAKQRSLSLQLMTQPLLAQALTCGVFAAAASWFISKGYRKVHSN